MSNNSNAIDATGLRVDFPTHEYAMYSQHAAMAPQKPETFMLSTEAQQALPHDAQVALQQVDNRELPMVASINRTL